MSKDMGKPEPAREQRSMKSAAVHARGRAAPKEQPPLDLSLFDHMLDGVYIVDQHNRIQHCNQAMARLLKLTASEIIGRTHLELCHHLAPASAECPVTQMEKTHRSRTGLIKFDGRWHKILASPIFDNEGKAAGAVHIFTDVTSLKHTEEALQRANMVLRVLNLSNQALVRSVEETALLGEVCRIVVESGGFRLAWAGLAGEESPDNLREVARAGVDDGELAALIAPRGEAVVSDSPAIKAMQTGKPVVRRFLAPSPAFGPGGRRAVSSQAASSIVLPLVADGRCLGALVVCATEPDAFCEEEVLMLSELAPDLAYGVETIRTRSKHNQAVRDLQASEEKYATLVERGNDGIVVIQDDKLRFANSRTTELTGRPLAELMETPVVDLIAPEYAELFRERQRPSLARKNLENIYEIEILLKDGERRPVEINAKEIVYEGNPATLAIVRDITERKAADREIEISHRFLEITNRCSDIDCLLREFVREIQDLTRCEAVGIRLLDESGNIPYKAYIGFSREFYEKESPLSIRSDRCICINVIKGTTDPSQPFYTLFGSFYANGTTRFLATVSDKSVGETRKVCNAAGYESVALIPFRLGGGNLGLIHLADRRENMVPLKMVELLERAASALGAGVQRAQGEEALRRSEEKYRGLFESSNEGVAIFRVVSEAAGTAADFVFLDVNPVYESLMDVKKDNRIGRKVAESDAPVLDPEILRKVAAAGKPFAYETYAPSLGKYFRVSAFSIDKERVAAILSDVTERRQAREQIRKLSSAVEQSPSIVVITDIKGRIEYVNPKFSKTTGYGRREIVGADAAALGSPAPDETRRMWEALDAGREWHGEFPNRRKSGELYWEAASIAPIRDGSGSISHYVKVAEDITERKRKDEALRESEGRLREAYLRLQDVLQGTIGAIATMAEMKDPYTSGHQRRVARIACAIAKEMGLSEDRIAGLAIASLLHDIGKIQIPSDILAKPSRLSDVEFEIIKTHPLAGHQILKTIPFPWPIVDMVIQHHERMDGSGYPAGLSGDRILLEARILGVADVLEAMASNRPYRPALGVERALEEVSRNSGQLYDAAVVNACLAIFSRGFKLDNDSA